MAIALLPLWLTMVFVILFQIMRIFSLIFECAIMNANSVLSKNIEIVLSWFKLVLTRMR